MSIAKKLVCPHILEIEPYQSARRIGGSGEVWLNANELPYRGVDLDTWSSRYNRYPEFQSEQLLDAYAAYAGLESSQLLCVRGADEGIELLIRCFCSSGQDSVVITTPTYGMYQVSAGIHNVEICAIPRKPDWSLDLNGLQKNTSSKLFFVCSPNNPTGNVTPRDELIQLLDHCSDSALVIVDEAYIEFCPDYSFADLLDRFANLVILRTMSKAFGMAALRCGFVLASVDVIALLKRIVAPYPVPSPVEEIAIQSLSEDGLARMAMNVEAIVDLRDKFVRDIGQLENVVRVSESHGNFVLIEFADEPGTVEALSSASIVVRTPYTQGLINNSQRISIGTAEEMTEVTRVLQALG